MNVLNKAELPAQQAAVEQSGAEPRVVLHDVSWQQYVAIGDILLNYPRLRKVLAISAWSTLSRSGCGSRDPE